MTHTQAQVLFDATDITDADTCTWIDECHEPAVRLGVFDDYMGHYEVKFLCDRHKQMGLRTLNEGWNI